VPQPLDLFRSTPSSWDSGSWATRW